jgi:NAD(P)-dependent dehydrogenase (short-subunit alcohol dehydrogenase family)
MGEFQGKVAIVTGAGQGIGEAYALALAQEGASVVVAEINEEAGERVAKAIRDAGGKAIFIKTDVASAESSAAMGDKTVAEFGGIDFLVNNAAIYQGKRKEGLLTIDYDYFKRFMEVNTNGPLIVTRAVYKHMVARGGGVVINQSSSAAWAAGDFYSLSKAGVNALTISLAREMGPMKIRVNAIAPGPTDTEATRTSVKPEVIEKLVSTMPLRRMGTTDDIVKALLFLLSDRAGWITGQILSVDGGTVLRL